MILISNKSYSFLHLFTVQGKSEVSPHIFTRFLKNYFKCSLRVTCGSQTCHRNTESHVVFKCIIGNTESHMWPSNVSLETLRVTCGSQTYHRKHWESHVALRRVKGLSIPPPAFIYLYKDKSSLLHLVFFDPHPQQYFVYNW